MCKIRFYADVTEIQMPVIRIEEGLFKGMILVVDTGSNNNILFGYVYNQIKDKLQPVEGIQELYGIDGKVTLMNIAKGIVSFGGIEYEMHFLIREDDEAAMALSRDLGFPICGIIGTNFMAEHDWIIDYGKQEITIGNPVSTLMLRQIISAKQKAV